MAGSANKIKLRYGLQSVVDDEETERRLLTGRGSWDEGREEWEGEAPAEPKTAVKGDWRMANDK
jgi:hypothetical protein